MRTLLIVHIAAGAAGLLTGYVALFSAKGGSRHRSVGRAFVYVMLVMALAGLTITVGQDVAPYVNIPAALVTAYLVVTALTTVRPLPRAGAAVQLALLALALIVGVVCLVFGLQVAGGRSLDGMPAFPFFMFATIALLGAAGDIRVLRSGPYTGTSRLARHLWRMCVGLFIAAMSFFIGQSDEFPPALRIMPLLAFPVLVVVVTMVYWLWRIRWRKSLRGLVMTSTPDTARGVT